MEQRRQDDERLIKIEKLVSEIHQRQKEVTHPALEQIEKTLYGNGKPGLCETVTKLDTKINMTAWIFGITISALGLLFTFIEFILRVKK